MHIEESDRQGDILRVEDSESLCPVADRCFVEAKESHLGLWSLALGSSRKTGLGPHLVMRGFGVLLHADRAGCDCKNMFATA